MSAQDQPCHPTVVLSHQVVPRGCNDATAFMDQPFNGFHKKLIIPSPSLPDLHPWVWAALRHTHSSVNPGSLRLEKPSRVTRSSPNSAKASSAPCPRAPGALQHCPGLHSLVLVGKCPLMSHLSLPWCNSRLFPPAAGGSGWDTAPDSRNLVFLCC